MTLRGMSPNVTAAGPASSTDIGVSESSGQPISASLHLTGTGSAYADFTWGKPVADDVYAALARRYDYDPGRLDATLESVATMT